MEKEGIDIMKKLIKIILLATFSILIMTYTSFSDEISHKKAAAELLKIMQLDKMLNETIDKILDLEMSRNPALQPYKNTLKKFFEKYMSAKSLEKDFITIYVEAFTEKELQELVSFYKTPTGQKALKATPELTAKGAALGQKRVQDNIEELQQMIAEEAQRIQQLQEKQ